MKVLHYTVTIVLAFEEGFSHDNVIVEINGEKVYSKEDLNEDMRRGVADIAEFNYLQGYVELKIILSEKNISKTIPLELVDKVFIKISIRDNKIYHHISSKPLRYM